MDKETRSQIVFIQMCLIGVVIALGSIAIWLVMMNAGSGDEHTQLVVPMPSLADEPMFEDARVFASVSGDNYARNPVPIVVNPSYVREDTGSVMCLNSAGVYVTGCQYVVIDLFTPELAAVDWGTVRVSVLVTDGISQWESSFPAETYMDGAALPLVFNADIK